MKTSDLITLKKYCQQNSALKYAEYLLKILRNKKESIVEEILADEEAETLVEFTKDAIDEYKQTQQGFIFIATSKGGDCLFKLSKTKNAPAVRIKQINNDLPAAQQFCLLKYWPVFDRVYYEKLIEQKIDGFKVNPDCIENDCKKIIAKIEAILESDYRLLSVLNKITPITPPVPKKSSMI